MKVFFLWKTPWLATAAAAAKSLQSCRTLVWPCRRQPTRLHRPWDSPGKNTGVGCHFLLQCIKVKSESEVTQLCPTLRDPMDCSPPGSTIYGIFQARILEWIAIAFSAMASELAKLFQSCLTLCDPMDWGPPGSSVHGISSKNTGMGCHALLPDRPEPGIKPESPKSPALTGGFFTTSAIWEVQKAP